MEEDFSQQNQSTTQEKSLKSKFLFFWVFVVLFAAIIFLGWLYFVNKNFEKIDSQLQDQDANEQASQELKSTFEDFGSLLKQAELDENASDDMQVEIQQ